jgi:hypothetical protein
MITSSAVQPVPPTHRRDNLPTATDVCGIKKNLTCHTFATPITLANGVPIETVLKFLGHKKLLQ